MIAAGASRMINNVKDVSPNSSCSHYKCEMSNNPNDKHNFNEGIDNEYPYWVKTMTGFQGSLLLFKLNESILYLKYKVCGFFFNFLKLPRQTLSTLLHRAS
jgi:hypothetical protein